jgi:hypothetical protein
MKVNISLVIFGAVAVSAIALPAQAATVFGTTSNVGGTITPAAAYRIAGLNVTDGSVTTSYDVDFEYGEFNTIFPAATPQVNPRYFANADQVGEAIVAALRNPTSLIVNGISVTPISSITRVIDRLNNSSNPNTFSATDSFSREVVNQFEIPISPAVNGGENFLSICEVGGVLTMACTQESRGINGLLMYAKFTPTGITPTPGDPSVPTPALIPGLLGMGLAALRKKKQSA